MLVDTARQATGGPVLPRLVEMQKANNWNWDDSVFQAMVDALDKGSEKRRGSKSE
jgi:hypothetical protein